MAWKSATAVLRTLIWSVAGIGFAYVTFYLPIRDTHGEVTVIKQSLEFVAKINAHVWVAWGTSAAAIGYALNERRLRHSEREQRDRRIRKLETLVDPDVSSSGLNASGTREKVSE